MLRLLGPTVFQTIEEKVRLRANQSLLLCAYLVVQDGWVNRADLLLLFWPEDHDQAARNKLRQVLHKAKAGALGDWLEVTESHVCLNLSSDLKELKEAYADQDWMRVLALYQGDLLKDAKTEKFTQYQDWLELERNDLLLMWREASLRYAEVCVDKQGFIEAAQCLKAVLDKDLFAEDVLQAYLRVCAEAGQRAEGLRTFAHFKRVLKQELQLEPLEETVALLEVLKEPRSSAKLEQGFVVTKEAPLGASRASSDLPTYATSFIGRDLELIELNQLALEARLISIVGAGGMGKTRLLSEFARQLSSSFADGLLYFPLAALSSADYFLTYCLELVSSVSKTKLESLEALLTHLQDKAYLLVFDNFEHVSKKKALLEQLLAASPASKIVLSSRETSGLASEFVFELKGLSYPPCLENLEAYEAVQLFVRTARRVQPSFNLNEANKAAVFAICQQLEGLPFALELAALWARLLKPHEIKKELERNLDILELAETGLAPKHQSARAVFEHSWALLSPEEQDLLKKVAVFRGGFSRNAAEVVADASLKNLLSLLNKSLISRTETGKFVRHVLVMQYSAEKLAAQPSLLTGMQTAHYEYYLKMAQEQEAPNQITWLDNLAQEQENLRRALMWALEQDKKQLGVDLCRALCPFWEARSYLSEGRSWLKKVLAVTKEGTKDYAALLMNAANLADLQSDFEETDRLAGEALSIFRNLADHEGQVDSLYVLGSMEVQRSDLKQAKSYIEESIRLSQGRSKRNSKQSKANKRRFAKSLRKLSGITWLLGDYALAREHTQKALATFRELNDIKGVADSLFSLSTNLYMSGRYNEAIPLAQESISLAETIGDTWRLANAHHTLGNAYRESANLQAARKHHEICLSLSEDLDARFLKTYAQEHLGLLERYAKNYETAEQLMHIALEARQSLSDKWGIASCLHRLAGLAAELGQAERAALLWGSSERIQEDINSPLPLAFQESFQRDSSYAKQQLSSQEFEAYWFEGRRKTLQEAIQFALEPKLSFKLRD